jgi:ABC-type molybdate transport system ATPase subunit
MSTINVDVIPGGVVSVNGQQGAVSLTLGVPGTGVSAIVAITQTAYDALAVKSPTTLYVVTAS